MTPILALFGLLVTASRQDIPAVPVVVPAIRKPGLWKINLDVDGKPVPFTFLLDFGRTCVDSPTIKSLGLDPFKLHKLSVEGMRLADTAFTKYDDFDEKGGILGIDLLRNMVLGFDLENSKVTIWPSGKFSSAMADTWIKGGTLRPGSIGKVRSWSTELSFLNDTLAASNLIIDGKAQEFRPLITSADPYIPAKLVAKNSSELKRNGDTKMMVSTGMRLGTEFPFFPFVTGSGPFDGIEPDKPSLGIDSFGSSRVLFDFQNAKLYLQITDKTSRSELAFDQILRIPLTIVNKQLVLGSLSELPFSPVSKSKLREGDKVISYKGFPAQFYIDLFQRKQPMSSSEFLKFFKAFDNGSHHLVVIRNGKKIDVNLPKN